MKKFINYFLMILLLSISKEILFAQAGAGMKLGPKHEAYGHNKNQYKSKPRSGYLNYLEDSLNAATAGQTIQTPIKKGPYLVAGILWYWFVLYSLIACCLLYLLIRLGLRGCKSLQRICSSYLLSERYWFRKLMRSGLSLKPFLNNLYSWWDRWDIPGKSPSITAQARGKHAENIGKPLEDYLKQYADGNVTAKTDSHFKDEIKKYRDKINSNKHKNCLQQDISEVQQGWN